MMARLREVELNDLSMIRNWRNHSEINRFMFSQETIKDSEHRNWFELSQINPLRSLYVYEENELASGFLQLQKKSLDSDVYEWGFYTDPQSKRGAGTRMTVFALNKVFTDLGAHKVFGKVLAFNQPSIQLHQKLGFVQEGVLREHHFLNDQYHDVHCFGLLKTDWNAVSIQSVLLKGSAC